MRTSSKRFGHVKESPVSASNFKGSFDQFAMGHAAAALARPEVEAVQVLHIGTFAQLTP